MSYLSDSVKAQIIATPSYVATLYGNLWHSFALDLQGADQGMTLSNTLLASAFASVCAWSMKPYGPETNSLDLARILAEPSIACDDYVRLTLYFMQLIPSCSGVKIAAIGWDNGAVGNHSQLLASDATGSLLLDPTVGLVANGVTYDSLTKGQPCSASLVRSFFNQYGGTPAIAGFSTTVINAVVNGSYKPSDALYYCSSLNSFNAIPPWAYWLTPQAAKYQLA